MKLRVAPFKQGYSYVLLWTFFFTTQPSDARVPNCCAALLASKSQAIVQSAPVDSGPQRLPESAITGFSRTPLQQAEWQRLSGAVGLTCSNTDRPEAANPVVARAAWIMGLLYLHGAGTEPDSALARRCFMQAWSAGEPLASAGLAWCAISGCGQAPNPETARLWLQRLQLVAPSRALYLRWWLENSLAPLQLPQEDRDRSIATSLHHEWLERAAKGGDLQARIELGLLWSAQAQWTEALRWFELVETSSSTAKANANRIREHLQNLQDAALLGRDIENAAPEVLFRQARRHHQGDGIPANYSQALMLYQRAAAKGYAPAQRMLGLIYSHPGSQGGVDIGWMQQLANMDVTGSKILSPLAATGSLTLAREPTALYDYLPQLWKRRP